jgi:hypothetical protein
MRIAPGVAFQVFLEPDERLEIEWFVGSSRSSRSGSITSKRARCARITQPPLSVFAGALEVTLAKGEPMQDALRLHLQLPAAMLVERMQRLVMLRRIFRRRLEDALRLAQLA